MGKGSKQRPSFVNEDDRAVNFDRAHHGPDREFPPPQPRCEDCKVRHDPLVPCDLVEV